MYKYWHLNAIMFSVLVLLSTLEVTHGNTQQRCTKNSLFGTCMKDVIFREYDIRGKVGSELILDQVYDLARAIAYYFKQKNSAMKTVAVAMDGRIHSPAMKQDICKALTDSGLDVLFLGMCPTPALYFGVHTLPVQAGLMITASHNPGEYNGIKICLDKDSVWGQEIQLIKKFYREGTFATNEQQGTINEQPIIPAYVAWLADHFKHLVGMDLSVLVDCGNGAAGTVLPQLVERMQWRNVELLYEEVDGTYPNHEADPSVEENLQELKRRITQEPFDLGIGFDGDCDRMAPMTKSGKLITGDTLLGLFAQPILKEHPGTAVVFNVLSSSAAMDLLEKLGARPIMSPVGHAVIKDIMKAENALLGGEISCHFFFADRYFGYDDGIYAMMRLFEMRAQTGKTLDELLSAFPTKYSSREIRLACPEDKKRDIIKAVEQHFIGRDDTRLITIDGVRATMPYGWGIIRASNTQPVLSMRFEADSPDALERVKQDFVAVLRSFFSDAILQESFNK